jgi:hypothetical protein
MPYGFPDSGPPALPALPGFGGGSPLFKPGLPGLQTGGAPAPNAGPNGSPSAGPFVNPFQTDINGSASVPAAPVTDPCSGIIPCTWSNLSPCFALATCRIAEGAKSVGIYLAAAGVAVVGIYLLIRK